MVHTVTRSDEIVLAAEDLCLDLAREAIPAPELRRAFSRLSLLYELGRQICAETEEARVFDVILTAATRLLGAERGFVGTLEHGRLVPRAVHSAPSASGGDAWPSSKTLLSRVLSERVSVLTNDAQQEVPCPSVIAHGLRSIMCCPLGTAHDVRGLLYVDNRALTGAFTGTDLQFLQALAQYASLAIANAQARRSLADAKDAAESRLAAHHLDSSRQGVELVGDSGPMRALLEQTHRAARKDVAVILVGETGTGKELIARRLHASSPRARGPFVAVNLRAVPATLVESELFGHEKGAFTGATERRIGRLELAHGGTLLLDEALDIPEDVQPKLLRVLEERTFQRVGGREDLPFDARVVGAFSRDPLQAVQAGRFRDDLYYRMATVTLELPPLRERPSDIPALLAHYLRRSTPPKQLDEGALAALCAYPWPGNVRELRNCVEALDVMVEGPVIGVGDLPRRLVRTSGAAPASFESLTDVVARAERVHFERALALSNGNNERAIELLGVSRAKFFQRKKDFGL